MQPKTIELTAIPDLPLVQAGDDLAGLIGAAIVDAGLSLKPRDVIVIAQKVVSKAEGRSVALNSVKPRPDATQWAAKTDKDPRLVELILNESRRVVRHRPGVMIVEHRLGFVMANAGIDQSNVGPADQGEHALLLPVDPDASAEAIRATLSAGREFDLGVIISDSFGRPFRSGTMGVAIGAAGIPSLLDLRGNPDLFGRDLAVSISGFADEIAAAASLLMGQGAEGLPVVIVSGLDWSAPPSNVATSLRDPAEDLFR